jgi:hypothetical protein
MFDSGQYQARILSEGLRSSHNLSAIECGLS